MQAVVANRAGGPDVLQVVDVGTPEPGEGQVRIAVAASSLNYSDILMRSGATGTQFPFTPGVDVAGTVDRVGPGTSMAVGAKVAAVLPSRGGHAEYVVADEAHLVRLGDVDPMTAAAALLTFLTAWMALEDTYPGTGACVLVHAAGGGVGSAAVQLATRRGARVAGLASTPAKRAAVQRLGADLVLDSTAPDWVEQVRAWAGDGVDVVLNGVGAATWSSDLAVVRSGARVSVYGFVDGQRLDVDIAADLVGRGLRLSGFAASRHPELATLLPRFAADVWPLLETGEVAPVVAASYGLRDAATAHAALASRGVSGKIVFRLLPG